MWVFMTVAIASTFSVCSAGTTELPHYDFLGIWKDVPDKPETSTDDIPIVSTSASTSTCTPSCSRGICLDLNTCGCGPHMSRDHCQKELYLAARYGEVSYVENALTTNLNPDWLTDDGFTALMAATKHGHVSVIQALVAAQADLEVAGAGGGATALYMAAQFNQSAAARELLGAGADVNTRTSGWTYNIGTNICILYEGGWTPLIKAASEGHISVVEALIDSGANVNAVTKEGSYQEGWTALMKAADEGHISVVEALIDSGANVNTTAKYGGTALMRAASEGHVSVIQALVAAQADLEVAGASGGTALNEAGALNHTAAVRVLLQAGANVSTRDNEGYTTLMRAAEDGYISVVEALIDSSANVNAMSHLGWTALMAAAYEGHVSVIQALVAAQADLEGADTIDGGTALNYAAFFNQSAAARVLLSAGADVNTRTKEGHTPLMVAASKGHVSVVEVLLGDPDIAVDLTSYKQEWTALHIAAQDNQPAIARLLLGKGADKEILSKEGYTPAALARQENNDEVARIIENY